MAKVINRDVLAKARTKFFRLGLEFLPQFSVYTVEDVRVRLAFGFDSSENSVQDVTRMVGAEFDVNPKMSDYSRDGRKIGYVEVDLPI